MKLALFLIASSAFAQVFPFPGPGRAAVGGGGGGITRVGGTSGQATGTPTTVTATYAPTTGNLVVVGCVLYGNLSVSSVTDGGTNTYTADISTTGASSGSSHFALFRKISATGGSFTYTCTASGATQGMAIFVEEWSGLTTGLDGTPITQTATLGPCAGACTTLDTGTFTTTNAADLLFTILTTDTGANPCTITPGTGWTTRQSNLNGNSVVCSALMSRVTSTTGGYNGQATVDNVLWATGIAAYK